MKFRSSRRPEHRSSIKKSFRRVVAFSYSVTAEFGDDELGSSSSSNIEVINPTVNEPPVSRA